LFELAAQGGQAELLRRAVLVLPTRRHAEGCDAGDVFRAGAALAFMPSAKLRTAEFDALADEKRAGAFGRAELVAGDRVEIHAQGRHVEPDFASGLDAVGMQERASFVRDGGNFGDGLDGAGLVVGVHDGDQAGIGCDGLTDGVGIDHALRVHRDARDVDAAAFEFGGGFKHGRVFDLRDDDAAGVDAEQGKVVGLGSAAQEDNLLGLAAEQQGTSRRESSTTRRAACRRCGSTSVAERADGDLSIGSESFGRNGR